MPELTRRGLLRGAAGLTGATILGGVANGCSNRVGSSSPGVVGPRAEAVTAAEAARRTGGGRLVTARLRPRPVRVDLGGPVVRTWAYGDAIPGPFLRAKAGDELEVTVTNRLPADTSIHWHGVALRNDMDGVPGITQDPIASDQEFTYRFTVPDPGTYFYHPHTGVQLDRGLYGALIVDDPSEPGDYDAEWIVVLDDWVDGTGRTPDHVLSSLLDAEAPSGSEDMDMMDGMGHMDGMGGDSMSGMGAMGETMRSPLLGGAGDVDYPHYLINGRIPDAPTTLTARPGQRVRVRIINAGSDTAFRVALGGHRLRVTHSDGFAIRPVEGDALLLAMGERFDCIVTVRDGVFPLVASAEGKSGQALAVVRTGAGRPPSGAVTVPQLRRTVITTDDLTADDAVRLPGRGLDRRHTLALAGSMSPYRWTINGEPFPKSAPLPVREGERVRLRLLNHTMMFHPMHLHGHTFGLVGGGARKDTVVVRPMQVLEVDLDADNPGQWAAHCHNIYHAEAGMMTTLSYRV